MSPTEQAPPQGADTLIDILKERIITMQYKPGRGLSAASLASEFGLSREPIREVMVRLNDGGYVESFPKSGSRVSLINLEKAVNERFLRKSTEMYALGLFVVNRTSANLDKMREIVGMQQECAEKHDFCGFIHYDDMFHKVVFQGIGKERVWETVHDHVPNDNRVRRLTCAFSGAGFVQLVEQHQGIIKAAEERDSERAKAILAAHLNRTDDDLTRVVFMFPDIFSSKRVPNSFSNIRSFTPGVEDYFNSLLVEKHVI